ncbi:HSF-type DNA-binding-domain-containing protein [Zychaea mexicana]|uniref:HSF-type DNA-binding-domain-containing protein n=1 Tax=Zychaea mexicana TaxID=64656 RepID=UPI0022FEF7B2|nr:HSF-type DNA-binding-domain-containing protein [Zychaea mexicana]KAI9498359.1 HSF-type DNA-binding-domain-containing protein [Zychaea mexicana]
MENSNLMFDEGRSGLQPGDLVFEEEQPHLQGELQRRKTLPSFVKKLWFIINDTTTDHLACWTHNGQGLYVPDAAAFAKTVLPQYFKHNNWQSFVRQLNLYGFRKVCDSEAPANSNNSQCHEQQQQQQQHHHHQHQRLAQEGWQFRHDCFRRDASHMLHHIVRKRGHCRQPLSDPSMSSVSAPSTSTMTNPFSAAAAAAAGNDVNDEVPARLAKIEQTMQQMEAKSATAQDCILQLRLAQTHQNETLCALLALAKGTLGKAKVSQEHMEKNDHNSVTTSQRQSALTIRLYRP